MIEVKVPDIGDFDAVEVIEIMVAIGDKIAIDDSLITVESDKASMEIPSSHAGIVKEIKVAIDDNVSEGSVVVLLEESAQKEPEISIPPSVNKAPEVVEPEPIVEEKIVAPAPKPKPSPVANLKTDDINPESFVKAHASPSVRKFARYLGANLGKIKGTGRNGRIKKNDVQEFVKNALATPSVASTSTFGVEPMPEIDFTQWGDVETVKLNKINILTGKFMHRNWVNVPHVTQFDEADITDLEAFRKTSNVNYADQGFKLTMVAFLLKAIAMSMKKFPRFNTSLSADGNSLIQKKYCHIGVAVATPAGLVVPVIRDVDKKSLSELALDLGKMAKKARDKKLSPSDMQGGCFTISSLGGIGGTSFTPIVNAPEVAILGVSKAKMSPIWDGKEFQPRLMCPLSLSYDHRVIDGAEGAAFTTYLSRLLSDIRELLI